MGLKKYEIITVGSDRRVRALRSWQVGDRYVNIGDVGGIVYDEKTLSQDGLCWLFRGNFGFPGARIGGDSIVDVGEAALSATGTPAVDILGSSVVVGSKLSFVSDKTAADAVVLKADDFEQGTFNHAAGANWETWKTASNFFVRTKSPIFSGGVGVTLKVGVPGYAVQAYVLDRDGLTVGSAFTVTGVGVTMAVPAGQYFVLALRKDPVAATVPADATAAQITFTGTYETKLSVIDSRVEINPATSTGTVFARPGGFYTIAPGAKYPEAVIRNSKVSIIAHANSNRILRLFGQIIRSTAVLDANAGEVVIAGLYSNIKNLTASGVLPAAANISAYNCVQATDCDNFAVSPTVFPGMAAAQTANMPFIFQGCNVPNGIFYHHAQIANTYKNIDFAKASVDLGKSVPGVAYTLVSSETEGMYRIYNTVANILGFMVESYDSISSIGLLAATATSYGTTIYKDAYVSGKFDFAGTNVLGSKAPSHPLAQVLNVQPRAVQGDLVKNIVGQVITGVVPSPSRVSIPIPFRVNGGAGLKIDNIPSGVNVTFIYVNPSNNTVTGNTGWTTTAGTVTTPVGNLKESMAFVKFRKTGDVAITPKDLAGVTVTVYNGCKIVNTGETAVNMKGNIRVEDNAILVNASITGTGYFGGNSVVYYNPAVWAALEANGSLFMKDNAVFAPTALVGSCALVHMEGNAKFIGSGARTSTELSFIMRDNAIIEGVSNTRSGVVMSGNAKVTSTGVIAAASRGALVMTDNASIEAATTVIGAITLAGNYKGNVIKTWIGKRTITDVNEPEYDNNVKSKYDL
ncbi:hypothetical protein BO668P2_00037 [Bacteroides phage BO668P2]|nr:hypothetical protein BO668P2_00037 [Bacteroides phage BO668P2]